jgi:hypothetical protein
MKPTLSNILLSALALLGITATADAQTSIDFAGTGDGITDNQTAFNNAAVALNAAGGGTLRIHAGTYAHSGTVAFGTASNVVCDKGAGLKATTDSSAALIFTGSNSSITGCRFISAAGSFVAGDNSSAVVFSNCASCEGGDNQIQGAAGDGYAITGAGSQQVQIRGGSVNAVKGNGVHGEQGAGGLLIDAVQFSGTGTDCIAIISLAADGKQIQDVTVSHNQCLNAGGNGIQIAGVLRGRVADNAVTASAGHGILIRPFTPNGVPDPNVPDSIDVVNNSVNNLPNAGYYSIALQGTQNTTVSENTIRNSSGIHQWAASSHLVISRNKIFNAEQGITLFTGLRRFSVVDNDIYSVQYSCVSVNGATDGIVDANRCFDPQLSGITTWGAFHFENSQSVCNSNEVFVNSQRLFDNAFRGVNLTSDQAPTFGFCQVFSVNPPPQ